MNQTTVASPITLTDAAVNEVKRLIGEQNLPESAGLRIGVRGGGCSGLSYALNFETNERPNDKLYDEKGIKLFIDPKSNLYLTGITIDFTSGLQGTGFVFNNPNATSTCGCGTSFSA